MWRARKKGGQYIADSNDWKASKDNTSTQRRVQAATEASLMFDTKLSHCMEKCIDVSSDGALRTLANPDIGLDDIEKQSTGR
jgi:hypothetical protein